MLAEWFAVTTIAGLSIVSPGPAFAVVVRNSLHLGRHSGLATAIGVACGDIIVMAANLLGIGMLFQKAPILFELLKVLGGIYLLWLGAKGLLRKPKLYQQKSLFFGVKNPKIGFRDGFFTAISNPKAFLFVFTLFAVVVQTPVMEHKIFYIFWIALLTISWFSVVALTFTRSAWQEKIIFYRHWIDRITGAILMMFAIKLLLTLKVGFSMGELKTLLSSLA